MIEFELDGVKFQGKHLTPEKSLDAFAILAPTLGTVLDSIDRKDLEDGEEGLGQVAALIKAVLLSCRDLPKLAPYFYPVYKGTLADGKMVDVGLFKNEIFGGKPLRHTGFLVAAIMKEFADFLPSSGSRTLQDLASICGFQITSLATGPSGA